MRQCAAGWGVGCAPGRPRTEDRRGGAQPFQSGTPCPYSTAGRPSRRSRAFETRGLKTPDSIWSWSSRPFARHRGVSLRLRS